MVNIGYWSLNIKIKMNQICFHRNLFLMYYIIKCKNEWTWKIIERDNKSLPFKFNGIEWINGRG